MKHALRKYISPCGSALFMVVSTMAALIVLVTAMYMSVLSSRQVQFATFDQEQAYVTSGSIGDMVYSYIAENNTSALAKAVVSLSKGESISTNGNEFQAFGGTADDDVRLGAYDVTITYLYDEGSEAVYDLAVTVENNGMFETTHDFFALGTDVPRMRRISNYFTATGYLPTDVWMHNAYADSTMYFDNEYTRFTSLQGSVAGSAGQGGMVYNFNITALGTLEIAYAQDITKDSDKPEDPLTWVIGNDFKIAADLYTQNFTKIDLFGKDNDNPGRLIVGGDMYIDSLNNGKTIAEYTEVYVLGNLYLYDTTATKIKGKVCVIGDIIDRCGSKATDISNLYSKEGVYKYYGNSDTYETITLPKWPSGEGNVTESDIRTIYSEKMNPSIWPKWTITNDLSNDLEVKYKKSSNGEYAIDYITENGTITSYGGEGNVDLNTTTRVLIIDTGDVGEVRTIRLTNTWHDSNKNTSAFAWNAWQENNPTFILTVGNGSLVIDVPDGVIYQERKKVFFGNIAWFTLLGGKIDIDGNGEYVFSGFNNVTSNVNEYTSKFAPLHVVHDATTTNRYDKSNAESCCKYVKVDDKELDLGYRIDEDGNKVKIDGKRVYYTCETHGGWFDIDDVDGTSCAEIESYYAGECDSLCIGRINKDFFNKFYAGNYNLQLGVNGETAYSSLDTFYNNRSIYNPLKSNSSAEAYKYPNVNIFLVSCSENAQIFFGKSELGSSDNVLESAYFGYIYAPYMTFVVDGGGEQKAGALRSMGGIVVSDLVVASQYAYLYAQPDVSIPGLVGKDWRDNLLQSFADKSWRMTHKGT